MIIKVFTVLFQQDVFLICLELIFLFSYIIILKCDSFKFILILFLKHYRSQFLCICSNKTKYNNGFVWKFLLRKCCNTKSHICQKYNEIFKQKLPSLSVCISWCLRQHINHRLGGKCVGSLFLNVSIVFNVSVAMLKTGPVSCLWMNYTCIYISKLLGIINNLSSWSCQN